MDGVIARLVKDKGFGFVKGDDGKERFFHLSSLVSGVDFEELKEGDKVIFQPGQSTKGLRAEKVDLA